MTLIKTKFIALLTVVAMLFSTTGTLGAADYTYCGGKGYCDYRTAPNLAPGIALGIIALAAIIAVAVQNSNNDHAQCHAVSN
jgi:ABC-type spermidine/putrescine transport system permease subunit II